MGSMPIMSTKPKHQMLCAKLKIIKIDSSRLHTSAMLPPLDGIIKLQ